MSTFEMVGEAPDASEDGTQVIYALAASTQLSCHLNEVLNVLISHESSQYESTMESLLGKRFEDGEVLYHERCNLVSNGQDDGSNQVLLGVHMAALRPSTLRLLPKSVCHPDQRSLQRLVFQSMTHRYLGKNRAVHVMKTLPKRIHDQIVPQDCCTALSGKLDHLGIAFDIESKPEEGTNRRHVTRIFVHAYAAGHVDSLDQSAPALETFGERFRTRTSMNQLQQRAVSQEAKQVLQLLTHQLSAFDRVIKRRRLGFQSFIYFPPSISFGGKGEAELPMRCVCVSCLKRFTLFRREYYCQLCGHLVCADCSQFCEVEARAGEVRKNRVCLHCVHRVDSCVFVSEDVIAALGPTVVPTRRSSEWSERFDDDTLSLDSLRVSSDDNDSGFEELSRLGTILSNAKQRQQPPRPKVKFALPSDSEVHLRIGAGAFDAARYRVQKQLESYVNRSLIDAHEAFTLRSLETASLTRNYRYIFDPSKTTYEGHPLPPTPSPPKEALRLHHIQVSGILEPEYDHSALDLLAEVAAKMLKCPIGFVSLVDEKLFHSVGTYPPRDFGLQAPRTESMCSHTVYVDKPLVIKDAQCDVRFAQMLVVRDHGIRFYFGFPVRSAVDGSIVATICTTDRVAHDNISAADYAIMETLAAVAGQLIAPPNRVLSIPPQPKVRQDTINRDVRQVRKRTPSRRRQVKPQNSKVALIDWK